MKVTPIQSNIYPAIDNPSLYEHFTTPIGEGNDELPLNIVTRTSKINVVKFKPYFTH